MFSKDFLDRCEKSLTQTEHSRLSAQHAQNAAEFLIEWGKVLFDFEQKSPGTKPAEVCRAERLRIIRLLRDNNWWKEYVG